MSLSKTSVGMGLIVAQALARKGIELSVVQNTPLEVLTNLSTQQLVIEEGVNLQAGGFDRPDLSVSLLSGSDAPMPGTDVSPHSIEMSETVAMLERVLNNTLDLTQNTVNPMINRVFNKIGEHIDAAIRGANSPLEIVQRKHDPIFDSVFLEESVRRYCDQPRDIKLRSLGVSIADPWANLSTGHTGMDQQLQEFLTRHGEQFAIDVWDSLFNKTPVSSVDSFARIEQPNQAVLTYFFAAKARQNPPSEANIELSEWRAYCSSLMAAAGATICAILNARESDRKFGRIVEQYPMEPSPVGQVVVNADKYNVWLSQGGAPELIFATIYGDRNFDPKRMLERASQLNDDWNRVMALYLNTVNYKRFDAMVDGLRAAITAEIMDLKEEDLVVDRAAYHVRLREFAHRAKQRDLQDLWHLARSAVCQVIFPHTDAEALLLSIDEQDKLHVGKDVRELALYATIELVARWLTDQICVKQYQNI